MLKEEEECKGETGRELLAFALKFGELFLCPTVEQPVSSVSMSTTGPDSFPVAAPGLTRVIVKNWNK